MHLVIAVTEGEVTEISVLTLLRGRWIMMSNCQYGCKFNIPIKFCPECGRSLLKGRDSDEA